MFEDLADIAADLLTQGVGALEPIRPISVSKRGPFLGQTAIDDGLWNRHTASVCDEADVVVMDFQAVRQGSNPDILAEESPWHGVSATFEKDMAVTPHSGPFPRHQLEPHAG